VALLMSSGVASAQECEKVWGPEAWALAKQVPQPDFTCVPLTEQLLVSLGGATKAEVIKAMKANGRWLDHNNRLLHFIVPFTDGDGGDVNFTFEGDKVVHILGMLDSDKTNVMDMMFSWGNVTTDPRVPFACSDLPGSRYVRCNKEK
jgi:hypothetical protein